MTARRLLLGCGLLVVLAIVFVLGVVIAPNIHISIGSQSTTTSTGDTQTAPPSTSGNTPAQNPTVNNQQPQVGLAIVSTANQQCPSRDFSLENGIGICTYSGGKLLICEGDINDSFLHHDSIATTGQIEEIDQTDTIDGRDNGGTCHYSPPWTLAQSTSSVKGGCGGGCATVLLCRGWLR
jgi:hypothetical protein